MRLTEVDVADKYLGSVALVAVKVQVPVATGLIVEVPGSIEHTSGVETVYVTAPVEAVGKDVAPAIAVWMNVIVERFLVAVTV